MNIIHRKFLEHMIMDVVRRSPGLFDTWKDIHSDGFFLLVRLIHAALQSMKQATPDAGPRSYRGCGKGAGQIGHA